MLKHLSERPFFYPAVVLTLGLIITGIVLAFGLAKIRATDNVLSVTGSAKVRVTSDSVKWSSSISRTVTEATLQSGYAQLGADLGKVQAYFKSAGIADTELTIAPVSVMEVYDYNNTAGPKRYTLQQVITIDSMEVDKVTNAVKNAQQLINQGVLISINPVQYYYSGLAEQRVALLGQAIVDAKARAKEIAQSNKQRVGKLKTASSGVVQVLAPNSVDVSDYGSYDTSTIEKDVMVTVRASFIVR